MSDSPESPQNRQPEGAAPEPAPGAGAPTQAAPARPWWRRLPRCPWSVLLDSALALAIIAVLGGGAYYLHQQMNLYHVPTPFEQAMKEQGQLRTEHEQLLGQLEERKAQAAHAGEQRRMRQRLAWLEQQLADAEAAISSLNEQIASERNQVLALQHEIRQEDKTSRAVAKGLLPGLQLGDVSTSRGKFYRHAVIYRVNGQVLTLRMPEGQAPVRVNELALDQMPDILRYAFNQLDLINMSDFETVTKEQTEEAVKATKAAKAAAPPARRTAPRAQTNYEPAAGSPVVDTAATPSTTDATGDDPVPTPAAPASESWQPPTGELPM